MAETPATPGNPFKEGAESSVDAQKFALTKALAEQGARGAQVIQNRGADAAALSAAAQQQFGVSAGNPLYQTFERDAAQAQTAAGNELSRIQASNQAYMDQVKGAIPIHAKDTEAYYESLRQAFADRQAEREQQMALARMAASRSGGGGGRSSSSKQLSAVPSQQRTPSMAAEAGAAGSPRDIKAAALALGMDPAAVERRWGGGGRNAFAEQDKAIQSAIQTGMDSLVGEDATWSQVVALGRELAASLGVDYASNVQPWLAVYSPVWGVQDSEWFTPLAKTTVRGSTSAGTPAKPKKASSAKPKSSPARGSTSFR